MNTDNANNLPDSLITPPILHAPQATPERKLILFLLGLVLVLLCAVSVGGYSLFSRLRVSPGDVRQRVEQLQKQITVLQQSLQVTPRDVQAQVIRLQERISQIDNDSNLVAALESSTQPIVGLNHEQEVVLWSRGAEALFGKLKVEVLGKTSEFMFHSDSERANHIASFYRGMRKDSPYRFSRSVEVENDGKRTRVVLDVIVDPGNLALAFFTLEDTQ